MLVLSIDHIPGEETVSLKQEVREIAVSNSTEEALRIAGEYLAMKAEELGANAVLGVNYLLVPSEKDGYWECHAFGTAVVTQPKEIVGAADL